MDRMERFYKIDQLLSNAKHPVPRERFLDELEISLATFKRDLEYLRDRMQAPIEYDNAGKGYRYTAGSTFQLPGLWMSEGEIYALLTMQHLIENIQPGMLDDQITPLMERITQLIEQGDQSLDEVNRRIRILSMARRPFNGNYFEQIAAAVLERQQLLIRYYDRANNTETERTVSPQRLVHYRENWYMDAWCHLRDGLRTFALECIRDVETQATTADDVDDGQLDQELGSGYGIFTGSKTEEAELRFNPRTARWIAEEEWHPAQQCEFKDDGYYHLTFPYSDDRELIQDILKYGANVEVVKPEALKERVRDALVQALNNYPKN